jgi:HlyD family secretion protein
MRRRLLPAAIAIVIAAGVAWYLRSTNAPRHYTGFVEGEERILRSEVAGRVVEVAFAEGERVPPSEVVARLADDDVASRIAAKRQQVAVLDAEIRRQEEQVKLADSTWRAGVDARGAELRQTEAAAALAASSFKREQALVATGASTAQLLDEARSGRDQARSALERARDLLTHALAEEGQVAVARHQLEVLREQRYLALAEIAELDVMHAKYTIRAPAIATVVQTQLIWPGELAQPGTAILSVLDPADKYVQIYVPVADVGQMRVGRRVEIDLDSAPGHRVPGEVSFVADKATFTPEKIESRSDRLGQVYRAKVRILEDVERFQPGTEGDVYLVAEERRDGGYEDGEEPGAQPPRSGP